MTRSSEGHVYTGAIEGGVWVDAGNLQAGFRLLGDDESWSEIVSVRITDEPLDAFNLTVADTHTYFVAGADLVDSLGATIIGESGGAKLVHVSGGIVPLRAA